MKKYLIGTIAVVFALGTVAFTKAPKKDKFVNYYFAFNTSYSPTEENVEDESKWVLVDDNSGCTLADQKACKIRVPDSMTSGNPRTLSSSANIEATQYQSTGKFYVSGGATGLVAYNTAQP